MRHVEIKVKYVVLSVVAALLLAAFVFGTYALQKDGGKKAGFGALAETLAKHYTITPGRWFASTVSAGSADDIEVSIGSNMASTSFSESEHSLTLEEAVDRLERLRERHPNFEPQSVRLRLALYEMKLNHHGRAKELYEEEIASGGKLFGEHELAYALLQTMHPEEGKTPVVDGSVTAAGKPLAYAYVSLLPEERNSTSMPARNFYTTVLADERGTFRFYDVTPGSYQIVYGTTFNQIKGNTLSHEGTDHIKVTQGQTATIHSVFRPNLSIMPLAQPSYRAGDNIVFQWSQDPAAAYYKLTLIELKELEKGKWEQLSHVQLKERHTETSASYTVNELRQYAVPGGATSYGEEQYRIHSPYVLGLAFPGSEWLWQVDAYNEEDVQISSSRDYFVIEGEIDLLRIENEEISEGDELFLKGVYQEAVLAYEREGSDQARRKAATIYMLGQDHHGKADYRKAVDLLEQIKAVKERDLVDLEFGYRRLGNEKKADELLKTLEQMKNNEE